MRSGFTPAASTPSTWRMRSSCTSVNTPCSYTEVSSWGSRPWSRRASRADAHDVQAVVVGDHMRQLGVKRAAGNIVDDLCALAQRGGGHGCARGVDGQYGTRRINVLTAPVIRASSSASDTRLAPGARGFGADVDDIRAGGHHVAPVLGRLWPGPATGRRPNESSVMLSTPSPWCAWRHATPADQS